jgi:hypothetical protein
MNATKHPKPFEPSVRKHLSADALFSGVHQCFKQVSAPCNGDTDIPLSDVLMSGFAMFSLKDPSLLAFDRRRIA